jgi:hypothetical protein
LGSAAQPSQWQRVVAIVGWRKTGAFHAAVEIVVMTCDVCERDIGHEDGRRPRAHFRVSRHPNAGAIDDQEPAVIVCSRDCLRAFATSPHCPDPASFNDPQRSPGKPQR